MEKVFLFVNHCEGLAFTVNSSEEADFWSTSTGGRFACVGRVKVNELEKLGWFYIKPSQV